MITGDQCRAARNLIDWSIGELAKKAHVSEQTISRFESNKDVETKAVSIQKMQTALEAGGVEFLPGEGIRKKTGEVLTLQGREGFVAFMTDVMEEAQKGNLEICVSNVDEHNWENNLPREFAEHYREQMAKAKGLVSKVLVKEDDDFYTAQDFAKYRGISPNIFSEDASFYAYGDKLALITFHNDSVQIVVLNHKQFADSFRVMFNAIWNNHEVLK